MRKRPRKSLGAKKLIQNEYLGGPDWEPDSVTLLAPDPLGQKRLKNRGKNIRAESLLGLCITTRAREGAEAATLHAGVREIDVKAQSKCG